MARGAGALAVVLAAGALALAVLTPVVVLAATHPDRVATGRAGADEAALPESGPPGSGPPESGPVTARSSGSGTRPQPLAWAAAVATGWAPARTAAIRPGVLTDTTGGGRCTSNFVFVAGPRRFLGQAAHCAGTGTATETDGCASGTRPLGTPVTIRANDGSRRTGRLAYSSWITMQARAETDPGACAHNDFALVELAGPDAAELNPSLPVLGGPTGLRVGGLPAGAPVFGYGRPDPARSDPAGPTPKAGTHAGDVGAGFGHQIHTASPGVPGESGSAFVDADGAAVGVLTTLNLSAERVSNGATDMAAALAYANAHGGLGPVTLALGTEPFRPAPG
jgi:hypothetical protein